MKGIHEYNIFSKMTKITAISETEKFIDYNIHQVAIHSNTIYLSTVHTKSNYLSILDLLVNFFMVISTDTKGLRKKDLR